MGLLAVSGRGLDDVRSRCAEPWEVISLKCLQERYILYFQISHNKLRLPPPTPPTFCMNYCFICSQEDCFQKRLKTTAFKKLGKGRWRGGGGKKSVLWVVQYTKNKQVWYAWKSLKIKRSWSTEPNTGYKWRLSSACPSFDPKIMIKS